MFESLFKVVKAGLEEAKPMLKATEQALLGNGVPIDEATLNALANQDFKAPIQRIEVQLREDGAVDLHVHMGVMKVAQRLYVESFVVNAREASVHLHSKGLIQNPIVGKAASAMVRAVLLSALRGQLGEDLGEDAVRIDGQDIHIDLKGGLLRPLFQRAIADRTGLAVPEAGVAAALALVEIRGVKVEAGVLRVLGGLNWDATLPT
jgi:hypothetical protein